MIIMGIMDMLRTASGGKGNGKKGDVQKCPHCGETVLITMERCPKCGTHIKSMFKRKCPNKKCETLNELDAKRCVKCGFDFDAELKRAERTVYRCPICGYKMEALLTQCPACNTRFM